MPLAHEPVICPTVGVALDHETPLVRVLPLLTLSIPKAERVTVDPTSTDGAEGLMLSVVNVGLVKNPLQLTARANVASAAKAPARRTLCFVDDIS